MRTPTAEQIAQWVIDNRYPKSEKEKVSDLEMYNHIVDNIHEIEDRYAEAVHKEFRIN